MRARIAILCALLSGCATLTPAGRRVAIAGTVGAVRPCSPVGQISRSAMSRAEAVILVRNEAGKRRADRVMITKEVQNGWLTSLEASAFQCAGIPIRSHRTPKPRRRAVPKDTVEIALVPTVFDEATADQVPSEIFEDAVSAAITEAGAFSVLGHDDINTLIDFEKDKDLLGCDEITCFTEIGGALGVPFLAKFNVARVSEEWVVTAKVIDVRETKVVRRSTDFVAGDTAALLKAVPALVIALLRRDAVRREGATPAIPARAVPDRGRPTAPVLPAPADGEPSPSGTPPDADSARRPVIPVSR